MAELFQRAICPGCFKLNILGAGKLQKVKVKVAQSVQLFAIPWVYTPWDSPGQNTGVGSQLFLYLPSLKDQTQVSHIAGGVFTS